MKFYNRYNDSKYAQFGQYIGELTEELDKAANLDGRYMKHYIVISDFSLAEKCIPIRVPGGTVGCAYVDDNMVIIKIFIDINYVVKTYREDINEHMKKFVGEKIEY